MGLSFEPGVLAVAMMFMLLLAIVAYARATGGSPRGGKIGEPDHEVTIVPAEEPVPRPVPPATPVREPTPHQR